MSALGRCNSKHFERCKNARNLMLISLYNMVASFFTQKALHRTIWKEIVLKSKRGRIILGHNMVQTIRK